MSENRRPTKKIPFPQPYGETKENAAVFPRTRSLFVIFLQAKGGRRVAIARANEKTNSKTVFSLKTGVPNEQTQ
ncbi:MAG: hypothetical protein LBO05_11130 [Deltaproteobacteria bacterium]|jgi:hypothetical protein|nr:hypothetical protein [Deltaproteobacteria bacterium]